VAEATSGRVSVLRGKLTMCDVNVSAARASGGGLRRVDDVRNLALGLGQTFCGRGESLPDAADHHAG
jgi:hypothetical protein